MNRKILVLLLGLLTACLLFTGFSVSYVGRVISNENDGLERVKRNDILKNTQSLLEGNQEKPLIDSLEEYQADITVYSVDGTVLYDNRGKDSLNSKVDINKVIEETGQEKQVYVVSFNIGLGEQTAIALLTKRGVALGIGDLLNKKIADKVTTVIWSLAAGFAVILISIFLITYLYVIRPFNRLKGFAAEVAKGNLDAPMVYPKQNIFGAFTWAFDMLRNELKSSREKREEAERVKKELVAVLSHDIRTPVSSIKAYAECLDGLPDKNTERSDRYIKVIIQKADELGKLSEDMFLHAISDLEKLEVIPKSCQSRELFNSILEPMILHYDNRILITNTIPEVNVYADPARLAQVCENILTNAAKYAPASEVRIDAAVEDDMLSVKFSDLGKGVNPEDLPFIFDKFFRGKNAKESSQSGSGLGLYICSHILGKMEGTIKAYNSYESGISGFTAEIALKIINNEE